VRTTTLVSAIVLGLACSTLAHAQSANPLRDGATKTYTMIKGNVTKAAAKMPEENYSFKPAPEVRTFGEIVGHIADANFGFCSTVAEETPPKGGFDPNGSVLKTAKTKADLEKVLAESFAYCDKVYAALTDADAAKIIKTPFAGDLPKRSFLDFNTAHEFEHYGNLVTYMRIKGLVPPSSEPRPATASKN